MERMEPPRPTPNGPSPEFWGWLQLLAVFAVVLLPPFLLIPLAVCAVGLPLWFLRP